MSQAIEPPREYTRHRNELAAKANTAITGAKAELTKVTNELDRLVQAIIDGVPGSQVKNKMAELEARKAQLEDLLETATEEKVSLHPNMALFYRKQVGKLREALTDGDCRTEAVALMRTLVDKIVLLPVEVEGRAHLAIDLHGDIAGILSTATDSKKPPKKGGLAEESIKLVAGAHNQLNLLFTACGLIARQEPNRPPGLSVGLPAHSRPDRQPP